MSSQKAPGWNCPTVEAVIDPGRLEAEGRAVVTAMQTVRELLERRATALETCRTAMQADAAHRGRRRDDLARQQVELAERLDVREAELAGREAAVARRERLLAEQERRIRQHTRALENTGERLDLEQTRLAEQWDESARRTERTKACESGGPAERARARERQWESLKPSPAAAGAMGDPVVELLQVWLAGDGGKNVGREVTTAVLCCELAALAKTRDIPFKYSGNVRGFARRLRNLLTTLQESLETAQRSGRSGRRLLSFRPRASGTAPAPLEPGRACLAGSGIDPPRPG